MFSCAGPISSIARSKQRAAISAIRFGLATWPWYRVIFEKIGSCSVSWKPPSPIVSEPVSGVMNTTGEWAQYAAAIAVTKLVMPGPFCAMQTPWRPEARA